MFPSFVFAPVNPFQNNVLAPSAEVLTTCLEHEIRNLALQRSCIETGIASLDQKIAAILQERSQRANERVVQQRQFSNAPVSNEQSARYNDQAREVQEVANERPNAGEFPADGGDNPRSMQGVYTESGADDRQEAPTDAEARADPVNARESAEPQGTSGQLPSQDGLTPSEPSAARTPPRNTNTSTTPSEPQTFSSLSSQAPISVAADGSGFNAISPKPAPGPAPDLIPAATPEPAPPERTKELVLRVLRLLMDTANACRQLPSRDAHFSNLLKGSYKDIHMALKNALLSKRSSTAQQGTAQKPPQHPTGAGGSGARKPAANPSNNASQQAAASPAADPPCEPAAAPSTTTHRDLTPLSRLLQAKRLHQQEHQQQTDAARARPRERDPDHASLRRPTDRNPSPLLPRPAGISSSSSGAAAAAAALYAGLPPARTTGPTISGGTAAPAETAETEVAGRTTTAATATVAAVAARSSMGPAAAGDARPAGKASTRAPFAAASVMEAMGDTTGGGIGGVAASRSAGRTSTREEEPMAGQALAPAGGAQLAGAGESDAGRGSGAEAMRRGLKRPVGLERVAGTVAAGGTAGSAAASWTPVAKRRMQSGTS